MFSSSDLERTSAMLLDCTHARPGDHTCTLDLMETLNKRLVYLNARVSCDSRQRSAMNDWHISEPRSIRAPVEEEDEK